MKIKKIRVGDTVQVVNEKLKYYNNKVGKIVRINPQISGFDFTFYVKLDDCALECGFFEEGLKLVESYDKSPISGNKSKQLSDALSVPTQPPSGLVGGGPIKIEFITDISIKEDYQLKCDCGAEKCRTTHSRWCSTRR